MYRLVKARACAHASALWTHALSDCGPSGGSSTDLLKSMQECIARLILRNKVDIVDYKSQRPVSLLGVIERHFL